MLKIYFHKGHNDGGRLLLSEASPPLDVVQQLASSNLLKHQVELVRLFKVLHQLDNVFVTLTSVEQINLLEDPRPAVGGLELVDDLDGVLHLSVDVDTGLNRGVGSLTKNLSC